MILKFEKWHGAKNDFVVVWLTSSDGEIVLDSLKRSAARICDRKGAGIAADGILVLQTKNRSDLLPYGLTIINSDGSLAQNCGNGLRCAALSVLRRHRLEGNPNELPEGIELEVEGAKKISRYTFGSGKTTWPHVTVEMGTPLLNDSCSWFESAKSEVKRVSDELKIPELLSDFGVCEIGNRHLVFFVENATRDMICRVGPAFQKSAVWDGINVHLAQAEEFSDKDKNIAKNAIGQKVSDQYKVLVWERGAGETQACGSGACAVVACAIASGSSSPADWVAVNMPGGRLYVSQEQIDGEISLAGPGEFVFEGSIEF